MNIIETPIPGVVIIEPHLFLDARGYFTSVSSKRKSVKQPLYRTTRANLRMALFVVCTFRNHLLHRANWYGW